MEKLIIVLLSLVLFASCTGVDRESVNADFDFTGVWNGTFVGGTFATTFNAVCTQNENEIAGTLTNDIFQTFSLSGTASGNQISLVGTEISDSSYRISCIGYCDGYIANGTWNSTSGQSGTWSAVKE